MISVIQKKEEKETSSELKIPISLYLYSSQVGDLFSYTLTSWLRIRNSLEISPK